MPKARVSQFRFINEHLTVKASYENGMFKDLNISGGCDINAIVSLYNQDDGRWCLMRQCYDDKSIWRDQSRRINPLSAALGLTKKVAEMWGYAAFDDGENGFFRTSNKKSHVAHTCGMAGFFAQLEVASRCIASLDHKLQFAFVKLIAPDYYYQTEKWQRVENIILGNEQLTCDTAKEMDRVVSDFLMTMQKALRELQRLHVFCSNISTSRAHWPLSASARGSIMSRCCNAISLCPERHVMPMIQMWIDNSLKIAADHPHYHVGFGCSPSAIVSAEQYVQKSLGSAWSGQFAVIEKKGGADLQRGLNQPFDSLERRVPPYDELDQITMEHPVVGGPCAVISHAWRSRADCHEGSSLSQSADHNEEVLCAQEAMGEWQLETCLSGTIFF